MENNIQYYANGKTFEAVIEEAAVKECINQKRVQTLRSECYFLSLELVSYINHRQSTSLKRLRYERVKETIDYLCFEAFINSGSNFYDLQIFNIQYFFDRGLMIVKQEVEEIKLIIESLKRQRLPIENDRYDSILDRQIERYLQTLIKYDGILNYCYIAEDLDYPLIDGLPLYQEMYQLKGVKLLSYYLKRFAIENEFCWLFKDEIKNFITLYEQVKGVEIFYLSINFMELFFHQCFAHYIVYHDLGLFINIEDKIKLKKYLQETCFDSLWFSFFNTLKKHCSDTVMEYLLAFNQLLKQRIEQFISDDYDLFIFYDYEDRQTELILEKQGNQEQFQQYINCLQSLDLSQKINYIKAQKISVYDLIDLLEHHIFMGNEYELFFKCLSLEELTLLIVITNPHLFTFKMTLVIDETLISELKIESEWQEAFNEFLIMMEKSKQKKLEVVLNQYSNIKIY